MRRALLLAASLLGAVAAAAPARPPEALQVARRQLDQELDLERKKTQTLGEAVERRKAHLRRRLRALYRLSQGGYVRLLVGADTPALLFARKDGLRRIVARDLAELSSVRRELDELSSERARLREREQRLADLDAEARAARPAPQSPFDKRDGLYRPVGGAVVGRFGRYRDASGVELTRDGVELAARPGEPVRALAAGEVRAVEELPGLGRCAIVDHGGGWSSLVGRLARVPVQAGQRVAAGEHLGEAAGPTVAVQVAQGEAWLDPGYWLAR